MSICDCPSLVALSLSLSLSLSKAQMRQCLSPTLSASGGHHSILRLALRTSLITARWLWPVTMSLCPPPHPCLCLSCLLHSICSHLSYAGRITLASAMPRRTATTIRPLQAASAAATHSLSAVSVRGIRAAARAPTYSPYTARAQSATTASS